MTENKITENISLTIIVDENEEYNEGIEEYNGIEYHISSTSSSGTDDLFAELELYDNINYAQEVNYNLNFTLRQLTQICDYYGIKTNKRASKKSELISLLVAFETSQCNYEIVSKRKQLWHYINELKNDKFMKKFVIW